MDDALAAFFGAGMIKLGRCVPSVCSPGDVAQVKRNLHFRYCIHFQGLQNVLEELLGEDKFAPFEVFPLSCHTAEEEVSRLFILYIYIFFLLTIIFSVVSRFS